MLLDVTFSSLVSCLPLYGLHVHGDINAHYNHFDTNQKSMNSIYLSAQTRLLVVQRKQTNKKNRQQIVFTMHSTTNHDMAALKTN